MKIFQCREVEEAIAYAKEGGQALHLHQIIVDWDKAPACFKAEVNAGRDIAHLFDQDKKRLIATARACGVKVILMERNGQDGQHIDLCGKPLQRAIALANEKPKPRQGTLDLKDGYGQ